MKRWWIWALIAAAVCIALFALVSLVVPSEFRFLAGHRPIDLTRTPGYQQMLSSSGMPNVEVRMYSFRADFKAISKTAIAELKQDGYTDMAGMTGATGTSGQPEMIMYVKGDAFAAMAGGTSSSTGSPQIPEMKMVMIAKDIRVDSASAMKSRPPKSPGWVSVVVYGTRPKSLLERFRELLGL